MGRDEHLQNVLELFCLVNTGRAQAQGIGSFDIRSLDRASEDEQSEMDD